MKSNETIEELKSKLKQDTADQFLRQSYREIIAGMERESLPETCTHIKAYECKICKTCLLCGGCECDSYYEVTRDTKRYWKGETNEIKKELEHIFVERPTEDRRVTVGKKERATEPLMEMKPLFTIGYSEVESNLRDPEERVQERELQESELQESDTAMRVIKIETDNKTYYVDMESYTKYLSIYAIYIEELIEYMGDTRKEREEFYKKVQEPSFQQDVTNYLFPGLLDIIIFTKANPQVVTGYINQKYKYDKVEEVKRVSYGIDVELGIKDSFGNYIKEKMKEEVRGETGNKRYGLLEQRIAERHNISSYEKYIRKRVYDYEKNR